MKKKSNLVLLLAFVMIGCFYCCQKDYKTVLDVTQLSSAEKKAFDLVTVFKSRISPEFARSGDDMKIFNIEKSNITFKRIDDNNGQQARAFNEEKILDVELYRFDFEMNGERGFSISCSDERVNRVLVYVENGSIEDTAYILGMAQMIDGIPYVCAQDLNEYYSGGSRALSRATERKILGTQIMTNWSQSYPYNDSLPRLACNDYVPCPVGGMTMALAQCLAFINKFDIADQYDLTTLRKKSSIHWNPDDFGRYVPIVASYIKTIGRGIETSYLCETENASHEGVLKYLNKIGAKEITDYQQEKSSGLTPDYLVMALHNGYPTMAIGDNAVDRFGWVMDQVDCDVDTYSLSCKKIYQIHCNWGFGGHGNGWYSSWYQPVDQQTLEPIVKNRFNRNNSFIYFKYTRR